MERIDRALLAAFGVVVTHQLAYAGNSIVGGGPSVAHGHLAVAWLLGSLAALAALGLAITRSLRGRRHEVRSPMALAAVVAVGYTAMEAVERLVDGAAVVTLATESVFWLGLAAAPLVAALLTASVRVAARIAERWLAVPHRPAPPLAFAAVPTGRLSVPVPAELTYSLRRRGPPSGLRI